MNNKREISTGEIFRLCCGDAGRAFIYGIVASFLLIFYVPAENVDAVRFIPKAAMTLGIIKGIGIIWDAVTDPLVASLSDKSLSKNGRRIPFMKAGFIPYAICSVMIFFPPVNRPSIVNSVYIAVLLFLFYTFSTLYFVPYSALQVEVVSDPQRRVFFYTINSLLYVIASALAYTVYMIKAVLTDRGFSYAASYRIPFVVFGIIGMILVAVPALSIKENELVSASEPCHVPILRSIKETFRYRNFVIMVLAYLVMWIGLTFFNSTLAYYITVLLGMSESVATVVLAISIVIGVISYPLINKLVKRTGKKPLLIAACVAYVVQFSAIYCYKAITAVISPMTFCILLGVFTAVPISVTNILPSSCFGDIAQYDFIKTGEKRTGMFLASKSFVMKLSDAVVVILVSKVISSGSADGSSATQHGVQLTALVAAATSVAAIILYALYNDREMLSVIESRNSEAEK